MRYILLEAVNFRGNQRVAVLEFCYAKRVKTQNQTRIQVDIKQHCVFYVIL